MSVLESYWYFIGSRASLPSGQGILVITNKKRKKIIQKAGPGEAENTYSKRKNIGPQSKECFKKL